MTTAAACHLSHEVRAKHTARGNGFAGGFELGLPSGGVVRSANITPDDKTGIGKWNKDAVIARFRAHSTPTSPSDVAALTDVNPGEYNTIIPWRMYAGMSDDDLGAIFAYCAQSRRSGTSPSAGVHRQNDGANLRPALSALASGPVESLPSSHYERAKDFAASLMGCGVRWARRPADRRVPILYARCYA